MNEKGCANKIVSIYDTFTDFIPLFEDYFSLNLKNSYLTEYNREITMGLFSLFATINKAPFLVGNPLESKESCEILKMLENKIKNTRIIKNCMKRPLCIILDREIDLMTPLMHTIGFIELINDIFDIDLNKVEFDGKKINLDADSPFFNSERFQDFPEVVDLVEKDVQAYKKEIAMRNLSENSDISKILENAPELQKKNEIVNNLLNISVKAVSVVKERKLDDFYSMEKNFNQDNLMELSEQGNENDIIRLCASMIGTKNADLIDAIFEKRRIDHSVINYLRKFSREENNFASRMKNILFKKNLPVVNYVDDVLNKVKNNNLDQFYETSLTAGKIYFDEISEVFVFINGGSTFTELKGLKELEKKYGIPVILGGTENLNADKLIKQLKQMK